MCDKSINTMFLREEILDLNKMVLRDECIFRMKQCLNSGFRLPALHRNALFSKFYKKQQQFGLDITFTECSSMAEEHLCRQSRAICSVAILITFSNLVSQEVQKLRR